MSKNTRKDAVNWFEIFVADFSRAKRFYETVLEVKLEESDAEGVRMGVFPHETGAGVGGAITKWDEPGMNPGAGGTMVYLNVEGDLDGVLLRAPKHGGEVIKPRSSICEHGFIGIIKDTEGNVVGLHSMS